MEEDEAGRLRAFRRKFGRAFDSREGMPAPVQVDSVDQGPSKTPEVALMDAPPATQEDDGAIKVSMRRTEKDQNEARAQLNEATAQGEGVVGADKPPSAAAKQQAEADPRGQGLGTTAAWGEDFGEQDNLMDLISDAGKGLSKLSGSEAVQRESQGKGKKK